MKKTFFYLLTDKELKKWLTQKRAEWNKNANFWIKIIREKLDPFRLIVTNKAILEPFLKEKGWKVLDAGCGEGYLCRALAKLKHKPYGIDLSSKLIEAAKRLEEKEKLGIKYFLGDFRKTPFPKNFFNAILSHHTINEIPNPEQAFKEFNRILKKKGKLVLLFLHPCFEIEPKNYFRKVKIKKSYYLVSGIKSPAPYFYLHLPLSQWITTLRKNGFSIIEIREPHPPLSLIEKDKWWKENFQKPLFILIEATKI